MADELHELRLTEDQKRQSCLILATGCCRETAAKFLGCSLDAIRQEMLRDPEFADRVRRSEAGAELTHMRNVQNAAREEKNWRASVWWLEHTTPDRYGRRDPQALTRSQVDAFIAALAETLVEEVRDETDRERLLARLRRLTTTLGNSMTTADQPDVERDEADLT